MKLFDCRIFALLLLQLFGTEFVNASRVKLKCKSLENTSFVKNTIPNTDSVVYKKCDIQDNILSRNDEILIGNLTKFEITAITASKCTWRFIPKEIFLLKDLKYLSLHNRAIESLKPEDFENAKNLETLYVKQNPRLTELEAFLFQHAKKLTYINLMENGLTYIHQNAFDELHYLTELYLQNNFLFMIHSETFSSLNRNLKIVNVTNNVCVDFVFNKFNNLEFSRHMVSNSCQFHYQQYNETLSSELEWKSLNISIWSQLFSFFIAILVITIVMLVGWSTNSKLPTNNHP